MCESLFVCALMCLFLCVTWADLCLSYSLGFLFVVLVLSKLIVFLPKMHLSPQLLRLLSVLRPRSGCSGFIVYGCSHCLWGFCVWSLFCYSVLCDFLVLQSSWWGRESWLLCFNCLSDVLWLLVFCGFSSRCQGLGCSVWLWYFLMIITCFFVFVFMCFSLNFNICILFRSCVHFLFYEN